MADTCNIHKATSVKHLASTQAHQVSFGISVSLQSCYDACLCCLHPPQLPSPSPSQHHLPEASLAPGCFFIPLQPHHVQDNR